MKRNALVSGLFLVTALQTQGAVILQETFDTYVNQAAMQAVWVPMSPQPSGTLSTEQAASGTNSLKIEAPTGTSVQQRNEITFAETGLSGGTTIIRFSFDFYDVSPTTIATTRQYANLQDGASPGNGGLISMGLNNNLTTAAEGGNFYEARVLGANSNGGTAGAYFKLNDNPALVRSAGWHNLRVDISATDFKFYVDNQLAETMSHTFTIGSFERIRLGSGVSSAGAVAWFDNVVLETIPEPSLALLLGLSGVCLAGRRRS